MRLCLASKRVEATRPLGQLPRYISSSLKRLLEAEFAKQTQGAASWLPKIGLPASRFRYRNCGVLDCVRLG